MEEMTGPSGSTLSILRRYTRSYHGIVSSERSIIRTVVLAILTISEVVLPCLLVISNREVAQIAV